MELEELMTAWHFAGKLTRHSSCLVKVITEGAMQVSWEFSMAQACCPSMTETHEFVVPESIPKMGPWMRMSWANLIEMCFRHIPVILDCWTSWCMWVVALAFDVGEWTGGCKWAWLVINADGHRWEQVVDVDGLECWRLELVIITLVERKKKKQNKTYLINWASAWFSIAALKTVCTVWVAATSDEVHSTQGLLEAQDDSQRLGN